MLLLLCQACKRMVGLKHQCRHPKTGELYIIGGSGGKNNSPEGHDVNRFLLLLLPRLSSFLYTSFPRLTLYDRNAESVLLSTVTNRPCCSLLMLQHLEDVLLTTPQQGLTHGFVVEFEDEEDRDYYVHKDPAHLDFVKYVTDSGVVEGITVIDFVPGIF